MMHVSHVDTTAQRTVIFCPAKYAYCLLHVINCISSFDTWNFFLFFSLLQPRKNINKLRPYTSHVSNMT